MFSGIREGTYVTPGGMRSIERSNRKNCAASAMFPIPGEGTYEL